jgi:hypothetical protein
LKFLAGIVTAIIVITWFSTSKVEPVKAQFTSINGTAPKTTVPQKPFSNETFNQYNGQKTEPVQKEELGYVTGDKVFLRPAPQRKGGQTSLYTNDKLIIFKTSADGEWLNVKVQSDGREGWVYAQYVSPNPLGKSEIESKRREDKQRLEQAEKKALEEREKKNKAEAERVARKQEEQRKRKEAEQVARKQEEQRKQKEAEQVARKQKAEELRRQKEAEQAARKHEAEELRKRKEAEKATKEVINLFRKIIKK